MKKLLSVVLACLIILLVGCSNEKAVKEAGRLREEGKEYIVQDGDIMEFRFNV